MLHAPGTCCSPLTMHLCLPPGWIESGIPFLYTPLHPHKKEPLAVAMQADDKKAAYWETHCDPASAGGRNGGAHLAYLSGLLKRNAGGSGFVVGSALSIAGTTKNVSLKVCFAKKMVAVFIS